MKNISIVTVSFNSADTIRDTIESVLGQNYPHIEYIIVDGGSTDGTIKIVEEYRHRITTIISEPDSGIYDAMNKGITVATGDIVGILNSDDVYTDNQVITDVASEFEASGADSVFSDLLIVDRNNLNKRVRYYSSEKFSVSKLKWGWMVPHPTFFVRKYCYEKFGLYKMGYRVAADFELVARFLWQAGISHSRLPRYIIRMREGGISSKGIWWRLHQNLEVVRACRENGIYTNILIVLLKVPFKLLEYTRVE
ncbi:glycosyltransferase [Microbulbifer rhizosphaerae]|uniref:Glycosyltransferase involved in cell wall biosynthesis n=1 Tax=Microbulbifer rhizosphaerae TaxID=1562603 RepID=A0A7W4ZAU4_9GAMM|nr:glycosyltransferase involved in cell wall biosynthesis [Microbulbifer rhizosphaerae]